MDYRQIDYSIALQRAVEYHCKGKLVPEYIAKECPHHAVMLNRHLTSELEDLQDKMHKIKTWIDAYPLDIFPEPDFKKAAKVLKENGMTLDSISASNMRHVLNGIKDIIKNR